MQLVVIVAVLAMAGVGQGYMPVCRPESFTIPVEACGRTENIVTTICTGFCYNRDPVYAEEEQNVCVGDWSDEVTHISGCPEAITYPVARHCRCGPCDTAYTYCGRYI